MDDSLMAIQLTVMVLVAFVVLIVATFVATSMGVPPFTAACNAMALVAGLAAVALFVYVKDPALWDEVSAPVVDAVAKAIAL